MVYTVTNGGLDFIENCLFDGSFTDTLSKVAIGTGNTAPQSSSTSLANEIYEGDVSGSNVNVEKTANIGEVRFTIEFTGGTEVPASSNVTEFGIKATDGTLVYRELRSTAITVLSGQTKIVEIRLRVGDISVNTNSLTTNAGLDAIANRMIGATNDYINQIAVGSGGNPVSQTDTNMQNEIYRGNVNDSNVSIDTTSNVGEGRAVISISAGAAVDDNVAENSQISEFGFFSNNGTMVLHETRAPIVLEEDDTKAFKIPFTIKR